MKKYNVFYTVCSCLLLFLMICGGAQNASAQCTPDVENITDLDFSYDVVNEISVTRIRFFLDYAAVGDIGVYGFQLQVYLNSNISGVSAVNYSLSGSWIFTCASVSANAQYDPINHKVTFSAVRTDCESREGEGFIGEIIITRTTGSDTPVQSYDGNVLILENLDIC